MIHISNNCRITHFSRSDNVNCLPSSNTKEILEQLLTSLYERYHDDLELSRENSSFIYESVEECNIHFHKVDLRRDSSFIDAPEWLKKKAVINPENIDVYCFMYAISIALFNKEFGQNPGRIGQNLQLHTGKWHFLALPSVLDEDCVKRPYKSLSRLMEGISSNSHENYYCLGCFHPFRRKTTLKNHEDLRRNNKFAKTDLPEE